MSAHTTQLAALPLQSRHIDSPPTPPEQRRATTLPASRSGSIDPDASTAAFIDRTLSRVALQVHDVVQATRHDAVIEQTAKAERLRRVEAIAETHRLRQQARTATETRERHQRALRLLAVVVNGSPLIPTHHRAEPVKVTPSKVSLPRESQAWREGRLINEARQDLLQMYAWAGNGVAQRIVANREDLANDLEWRRALTKAKQDIAANDAAWQRAIAAAKQRHVAPPSATILAFPTTTTVTTAQSRPSTQRSLTAGLQSLGTTLKRPLVQAAAALSILTFVALSSTTRLKRATVTVPDQSNPTTTATPPGPRALPSSPFDQSTLPRLQATATQQSHIAPTSPGIKLAPALPRTTNSTASTGTPDGMTWPVEDACARMPEGGAKEKCTAAHWFDQLRVETDPNFRPGVRRELATGGTVIVGQHAPPQVVQWSCPAQPVNDAEAAVGHALPHRETTQELRARGCYPVASQRYAP